MNTRLDWFQADRITVAGYVGGERVVDGHQALGPLAVEIEGPDGVGVLIEGSKSELMRLAIDIVEATLIADARETIRAARLAALQSAEAGVEDLKRQTFSMVLTPEQFAAINQGKINGYSIGGADIEAIRSEPLTPEQQAAFEAGKAGWDLAGPGSRIEALTGNGKVGKYTIAELEAMPMDDYLAACQDLLGTTDEPE